MPEIQINPQTRTLDGLSGEYFTSGQISSLPRLRCPDCGSHARYYTADASDAASEREQLTVDGAECVSQPDEHFFRRA